MKILQFAKRGPNLNSYTLSFSHVQKISANKSATPSPAMRRATADRPQRYRDGGNAPLRVARGGRKFVFAYFMSVPIPSRVIRI